MGKFKYDLAQIEEAKQRVMDGETASIVSKSLGIPRTTIINWINKNHKNLETSCDNLTNLLHRKKDRDYLFGEPTEDKNTEQIESNLWKDRCKLMEKLCLYLLQRLVEEDK